MYVLAQNLQKKNAWMSSFMDLILLLVCFFVMIFGITKNSKLASKIVRDVEDDSFAHASDFSDHQKIILDALIGHIKDAEMQDYVKLEKRENKISLVIPHEFLFDENKLHDHALSIANFLSKLLFNITNYRISISNHIVCDIKSATEGYRHFDTSLLQTQIANMLVIQKILQERGVQLFLNNTVVQMAPGDINHIRINLSEGE